MIEMWEIGGRGEERYFRRGNSTDRYTEIRSSLIFLVIILSLLLFYCNFWGWKWGKIIMERIMLIVCLVDSIVKL